MTEDLILVTIITMVASVQNGKRVNMKQLGDHDDVFLSEIISKWIKGRKGKSEAQRSCLLWL